ncbi:MAG: AI-2E family transporter, partial [Pseudomonadota bacterium]
HYFSYFLVSIIFSFLILMDYPRLKTHIQALRQTRLKEIYEQTAESVFQFAQVVGTAFQAQIMIAMVNAALTAGGLYGLGIHPIFLLSTIVFFCGLIPVLGVFLSSAPIILLAINIGGFKLALAALILIIVIHIIEAYILNPNIYSAVLKINPVLTLIILYLGGSFFGLWGVLLGVPVALYFYRYTVLESMKNGSRETHSP